MLTDEMLGEEDFSQLKTTANTAARLMHSLIQAGSVGVTASVNGTEVPSSLGYH